MHTRRESFDPLTSVALRQNPVEVFGEDFEEFEVPLTPPTIGVKDRTRNFLLYNYRVKKTLFELLRSRLFRSNPVYHAFYRTRMVRRMREMEMAPEIVQIENTTFCNQSCVFCPHPVMERAAGIMDLRLYKKIVDDAADLGVKNLALVGLGEPLLDQFFADRAKYAKFKGIPYVFSVSNLVALTPEKAEKIVMAGLDFIGVSIDAANKDTYRKIHKSNYEVVKRNVQVLHETKKRLGSKKPILEVRFRHQQANYHEVDDFVSQFKPISDHVAIYCMIHNWGGAIDNSGMSNYSVLNLRYPCKNLWYALYVCWDGRVGLCCLDSECKAPLGDMKSQSVQDVWQGKILRSVRKHHLDGLYNRVSPCTDCTENEYFMQPTF